jgi:flagellum-specific ATP synthase
MAEVVGFRGNRTLMMALDSDAPHSAARGRARSARQSAEVGEACSGRVVDALGIRSTARPDRHQETWPLAGARQPARSRPRHRAVRHGVRAVNALLTAGVGQRIAIVAARASASRC